MTDEQPELTYDALMLYIKDNPDITSPEMARYFDTTTAKIFHTANRLIRKGLIYKTTARSPFSHKLVFGYRVIDGFDEIDDNEDGSIPRDELIAVLRRCYDTQGLETMVAHLRSHNEWRDVHKIPRIQISEVIS